MPSLASFPGSPHYGGGKSGYVHPNNMGGNFVRAHVQISCTSCLPWHHARDNWYQALPRAQARGGRTWLASCHSDN